MSYNDDKKIELYNEIENMEQEIMVLDNKIKKLFKEKLLKQNQLMKLKKLFRG